MDLGEKLEKLKETAGKYNNLDSKSLRNRLKKAALLVPLTWIAGSFDRPSQEYWMERFGFRKENAKYLTIANASIFGLGSSWLVYKGYGETFDLLAGLDFVRNIKSGFLSGASNLLGTTSEVIIDTYVVFNTAQSAGRILYTSITGKPFLSLCFTGLTGSAITKKIQQKTG